MPISACAATQSDQGLPCLLTELDTVECFNGEQKPRRYFRNEQEDKKLHILWMFECTFSLDSGPHKTTRGPRWPYLLTCVPDNF